MKSWGILNIILLVLTLTFFLLSIQGIQSTPEFGAIEAITFEIETHSSQSIKSVTWSPDGQRFVTGGSSWTEIYDASNGNRLEVLNYDSYSLKWHPTENIFAGTSVKENNVALINPTSGEIEATIEGTVNIYAVDWNDDGSQLVAKTQSNQIIVYNYPQLTSDLVIDYDEALLTLDWNSENVLAFGSDTGEIVLYDVATSQSRILGTHLSSVITVAWSPEGDKLASLGRDGRIKIWDSVSNDIVTEINLGITFEVFNLQHVLSWHPDGELIASVVFESDDLGWVGIWYADSGEKYTEFKVDDTLKDDQSGIRCLSWSPAGDVLLLGSGISALVYDPTIDYNLEPEYLIAHPELLATIGTILSVVFAFSVITFHLRGTRFENWGNTKVWYKFSSMLAELAFVGLFVYVPIVPKVRDGFVRMVEESDDNLIYPIVINSVVLVIFTFFVLIGKDSKYKPDKPKKPVYKPPQGSEDRAAPIMYVGKLRGYRSSVSLAVIIGIIAIVINFISGFSLDTIFWSISILQMVRWYLQSETFIERPSPDVLKSLKRKDVSFFILWVLAAVASLVLWQGIRADAALGIIVSLSVSYLMSQFDSEAKQLLSSPTPSNVSTSSPSTKTNISNSQGFCGNCGAELSENVKFCNSCGTKV